MNTFSDFLTEQFSQNLPQAIVSSDVREKAKVASLDTTLAVQLLNKAHPQLGTHLYSHWIKASETYFDATPSDTMTPEEQLGLNPVPDEKLRRTNPKRYDIRQDWYTSDNEFLHDSPVSNRFDNPQPVAASLKLSWEVDPKDVTEADFEVATELIQREANKAFDGDVLAQQFLSKLWDGESWESIQKKLETEGSNWIVWWEDGISKYVRDVLYGGSPFKETSLEALDQLDWEIEHYVEGASLSKSSSLQLFSFTDLLLQRRCAYLQTQGEALLYQDFAQEVRDFIDEKFQDLLERHPEAKEHLNSLSLEFNLRPEDYRDTIGAEYYPESKTIGYYLPKETLEDNWSGIVHEIVHALQDFFNDSESSLTSSPEVTASYLTDKTVYRNDVGEKQAYAIEQEFRNWITNYATQ